MEGRTAPYNRQNHPTHPLLDEFLEGGTKTTQKLTERQVSGGVVYSILID